MRLHKVVNRVVGGTVYYRWILNVPPKAVRQLGWVDGQRLDLLVQGASLSLHPARPGPTTARRAPAGSLREFAAERAGRRPVRSTSE